MDLVKAMEFIQENAKPNLVDHCGDTYTDKHLDRIPNHKYPDPIKVSTLNSFVSYINSGIDFLDKQTEDGSLFLIIIDSPTKIRLVSELDSDENRRSLIVANAALPDIIFDRYMDREFFQIQLQSKFEPSTDRETLLSFISSVEAGTLSSYGDDGISQRATVSKGARGKFDVIVPNPVNLSPFRTFIEISQPESSFVFRMTDSNDQIACGIWEADGGAWKAKAVDLIKEYLRDALRELTRGFLIIG